MSTIAKLAVIISAKSTELQAGLKKATAKVKEFAKSATKTLAKIGAGLAAGVTAGVVGITAAVSKYSEEIDKMAKFSTKFGLTVAQLQKFYYAAELTGVSVSSMNMSIQKMVRNVSEASLGIGTAKEELKELGLSAKYLNDLSPEQQFIAIGEAMASLKNQNDAVRIAVQIFGRSGTDVLNTFKSDVRGLFAEFDTLGITITQGQARMVEAFNDSKTKMSSIFSGFGIQLTAQLAAPFKQINDWITEAVKNMGGMDKVANFFATAMVNGIAAALEGGAALINFFREVKVWLLDLKLASQNFLENLMFGKAIKAGAEFLGSDFQLGISADRAETQKQLNQLQSEMNKTNEYADSFKDKAEKIRGLLGAEVGGELLKPEHYEAFDKAANNAHMMAEADKEATESVKGLANAAQKAAQAISPAKTSGNEKIASHFSKIGGLSSGLSSVSNAEGLYSGNAAEIATGQAAKNAAQNNMQSMGTVEINMSTDTGKIAGKIFGEPAFLAGLKSFSDKQTNQAAKAVTV